VFFFNFSTLERFIMRHVPTVLRVLMGLIFVVFGLNFFLNFLPMPPMEGPAGAFMGALMSGKVLLVAKIVEIASGVMLLAGRFVPLALTLLAPIVVNIVLFHTVLAPMNPMPVFLLVAGAYLAWSYRSSFAPMLRADAKPTE
jgi:putative oxidoreductase